MLPAMGPSAPAAPAANHRGQSTGKRLGMASTGLGRCLVAICSTQSAKGSHLEASSRTAALPAVRLARSRSFQPGIWACIFLRCSRFIDLYAASYRPKTCCRMNSTNMGLDFVSSGDLRWARLVFLLKAQSPHSTFCRFWGLAPILAAIIEAKVSTRKAHPWDAEAKATFPRSGAYRQASSTSASKARELDRSMSSAPAPPAAEASPSCSASFAMTSSESSCWFTAFICSTILTNRW
mmetsp:Transcript_34061/g.106727  ORF Transcript_34061/g.106727 Transcript_34061/m.106727 type:complete len:237 (+) Transcript_34061:2019-2729(+)